MTKLYISETCYTDIHFYIGIIGCRYNKTNKLGSVPKQGNNTDILIGVSSLSNDLFFRCSFKKKI